jgi:hypothetical protein
MDFLEFAITALLADRLASTDEEAEVFRRLKSEIEELTSEIENLRSDCEK